MYLRSGNCLQIKIKAGVGQMLAVLGSLSLIYFYADASLGECHDIQRPGASCPRGKMMLRVHVEELNRI